MTAGMTDGCGLWSLGIKLHEGSTIQNKFGGKILALSYLVANANIYIIGYKMHQE